MSLIVDLLEMATPEAYLTTAGSSSSSTSTGSDSGKKFPNPVSHICPLLMSCIIISAACTLCWDLSIEELITENLLGGENKVNYLALSRRPAGWTSSDRARQIQLLDTISKNIPDDLQHTSFGECFPRFIQCTCKPEGCNFHPRMSNSNGKYLIYYLILSSLGRCVPVKSAYSNIMKCVGSSKFFKTQLTTHTKGQPHTDPTLNKYTGDVIAMGLTSTEETNALTWLIDDSPRTPKIIIADAESSYDSGTIIAKTVIMKSVMCAYTIGQIPILGLVIGGDMIIHALMLTSSGITEFTPLDKRDISEPVDIPIILRELNKFFHKSSIVMTEEMRVEYPINRSRSSSVASQDSIALHSSRSRRLRSSGSSASHPPYSLRSCGQSPHSPRSAGSPQPPYSLRSKGPISD